MTHMRVLILGFLSAAQCDALAALAEEERRTILGRHHVI
jgi:hypothetical protein